VSLKKPTEFFGKNNNQKEEIATFSTEIIGGSLVLLGHPSLSSTTTFKVLVNAINT
jgi:hypothetical protein